MKQFKVLLFDLDNTLIDRNFAVRSFMKCWLSENCPYYNSYQLELELIKIMKKDDWGYTNRNDFFNWVLFNYPGNFTFESLKRKYLDTVPTFVEPLKESNNLILKLSHKYSYGILTNGESKTQRLKLKFSGLDNFFSQERIFVSGEFGFDKPDVEIYRRVLEILDVKAQDVLMVGDDALNDVHGAKEAGLYTCWISFNRNYPEKYHKPDFIVNSISEVAGIV